MAGKLSKTELKKITRTLTDNEAEMIDKQRKFGEIDLTGKLRELYVKSEEGRYSMDNALYAVDLKLQKIHEIGLMILRDQVQIKGGDVWRHVEGYPDVKMTEAELHSEIVNMKFAIEKEISGIRSNLSNLITYVEQLGVDGNVMLTEKVFRQKVTDVELKLSSIGYRLL